MFAGSNNLNEMKLIHNLYLWNVQTTIHVIKYQQLHESFKYDKRTSERNFAYIIDWCDYLSFGLKTSMEIFSSSII